MWFNLEREKNQLIKKILDISEDERRIIGKKIHDGMGHDLLKIAMKIGNLAEWIDDKFLPEINMVKEIEKDVISAIKRNRILARGVFPVDFEDSNIIDIIEEFRYDLDVNHGISSMLAFENLDRVENIKISSHLYYIIKETFRNIIRHSRADKVRIAIKTLNNFAEISIKDNGNGLKKENLDNKGFGIKIMRYRAEVIGAQLSIQNVRSSGTEVVCRIKID